jgi:hypothetical protein
MRKRTLIVADESRPLRKEVALMKRIILVVVVAAVVAALLSSNAQRFGRH